MNLSRAEIGIFTASIKADSIEVASEHCVYLMRQGLTPADALHLIGRGGSLGWGGVIAVYATAWRELRRRNVLREGLV